jgi:cell division protein FtsL
LSSRLIAILIVLLAVIASSLGVVYTRHESRREAVALGQLENERDAFIAEWSRLQLEQAWLADASHIESKATENLGMRTPEDTVILVVEP